MTEITKKRRTSIFQKLHFRSKSQDNTSTTTSTNSSTITTGNNRNGKDKRNARLSLGDVSKLELIFSGEDGGGDEDEEEDYDELYKIEPPSPITSIWSKVQYKLKFEEEKTKNIYLESNDIESKLYNSILDYDIKRMENLLENLNNEVDKDCTINLEK